MTCTRRSFLSVAPLAIAPVFISRAYAQAPALPPTFPTQEPELAREMVGASHGNIAKVKELLAKHRTLALASWDWGFGDWEDALGAASHVGNREIAALLIAHGARPSIFSAAMLGQLDVVKGFIAASPGIEATHGPHGITLMRHAAAGGANAQAVVDYLKTLPDADRPASSQPLAPESRAALAGEYESGADRFTVAIHSSGALTFARTGGSPRNLMHVGDLAFFPVGAPAVRIRFAGSGAATIVTVHDPDLVLTARKRS
jgi:hypothetical protein